MFIRFRHVIVPLYPTRTTVFGPLRKEIEDAGDPEHSKWPRPRTPPPSLRERLRELTDEEFMERIRSMNPNRDGPGPVYIKGLENPVGTGAPLRPPLLSKEERYYRAMGVHQVDRDWEKTWERPFERSDEEG